MTARPCVCGCGASVSGKYARYSLPCASLRRRKTLKYAPTPEIDALIREAWSDEDLYGKAAALWVAERMPKPTWPKWKIIRRALAVGCAKQNRKEPPWSVEEIAILEANAWKCEERIQVALKRAGFWRTRTAVHLKRRRLKLLANLDGYTPTRLAALLGQDSHKVLRWIKWGWLHAERRGTARVAVQGGDMWYVAHRDFRAFVLSHPEEIDLGKADKLWIMDLLTDGRIGIREKTA